MKLKLVESEEKNYTENRLNEFPENVLGIIRQWGNMDCYKGLIVVRKGNSIFSLAYLNKAPFGEKYYRAKDCPTWDNYKTLCDICEPFYIEVLTNASQIEVSNNQ